MCSLSFKHVSTAEIVEDEDSQIRYQQAYASFLAEKRFMFDVQQIKSVERFVLNEYVYVF